MNGTATLERFDDVADSTDWLPTPLSGLAGVEAALRCQVCKDFYKTPMLTSCHHTFCSICIRRALSSDGKCPLCRASEQELKLRNNWSMEEVVAAFTQARSHVLLFARKTDDDDDDDDDAADSAKRKLDKTEESPSRRSGKRLRSSTRPSKSSGVEVASETARVECPDSADEDPTYCEPDDGLVECPICLQRMKAIQVDRHLDTSCAGSPLPRSLRGSPSKPSRPSRAPPPPQPPPAPLKTPERLPAVNYAMLKDAVLRRKLVDLGLSTAGNRQALERRHREWTTIWNANCDSQRPRRKADLLHDLDAWERTLGARAPAASRALALGAQIRDKDFDGAAWAARHDASFRDLIASARRNKPMAAAQTKETEAEKEGGAAGREGLEIGPAARIRHTPDIPPEQERWEGDDEGRDAIGDLTGDDADSTATVNGGSTSNSSSSSSSSSSRGKQRARVDIDRSPAGRPTAIP
ncbi:DNA repair protein rad18 [Durotheca rogersii]|uniref:DNA repair protein rad18 n=1 Tax=Durotheca rogersii TaxID=419775 RepID=UPI00221EE337|nr:DNA repair protein rad18 [Durotheca rogersii]KAI5861578.1 DNA repair protein rad18 [Durotheca rogersii]